MGVREIRSRKFLERSSWVVLLFLRKLKKKKRVSFRGGNRIFGKYPSASSVFVGELLRNILWGILWFCFVPERTEGFSFRVENLA